MDYNLKLWFLFYFFYFVNCQYKDPYLSECEIQQKNNTYVKNCDLISELSVVRAFYDNEDFVCVLLDNRNGRYSNQIIQIKILQKNNYRVRLVSI